MKERSWSESQLKSLIGQNESIRREFKSGKLFDGPDSKWIEVLSKEVSAFANTEGGELILGMAEDRKSKPKAAIEIDGVTSALAPERLQQLIEGNVSPLLRGIRVHPVRLSQPLGRLAYVVTVPQGNTAYQAKDGRYYGRSEFEVKHLHDRDIRLRMERGKVARAVIDAVERRIVLGSDEEGKLRAEHAQGIHDLQDGKETGEAFAAVTALVIAKDQPDRISFDAVIQNDGDVTIREPVVAIKLETTDSRIEVVRPKERYILSGEVIYPGDERPVGNSTFTIHFPRDLALPIRSCLLRWTIFLDNAPPSEGVLDIGRAIQRVLWRVKHVKS